MGKKFAIIAASGAVILILIGLLLGLGEVSIRSVHLIRDGIPFFESNAGGRIGPLTLDPELGWKATEHYQESLVEKTNHGTLYPVHRSQTQYGFRSFGDVTSHRPKLLVIGDSFTHATSVSDDRTYHALLSKLLGVEVFAYGAGGFGTLQEYLVFDRYFDFVRPDVILWQYCNNDFINNDNELERLSRLNNNGWTRPYWRNGKVQLLSPKESSLQIRDWINRHSRFLYFVVTRLDRLQAATTRDTVEVDIETEGIRHAGFSRAIGVTDELMGRVRARAGARPIMAFNCAEAEPYSTAFRDISTHHAIAYWGDVAQVVQDADVRGEDVFAADGSHWNERGNELAAQALAKHLRAILPPTPSQP